MKTAISMGVTAWLLAACGKAEPPPASPASPALVATESTRDAGVSPPVANAEAVVRAMQADLRKCYNDALVNDPKLEGAVTIEAKVDPTGSVTSSAPTATTTLPPSVTDCIAKRIQQAKFAPPGASGSTLQIPFTFKTGT